MSWSFAAVRRRVGLTVTGLILIIFAVAGWIGARLMGGRALYLLVYIAVAAVIAGFVIAGRRRPLHASRSALSPRCRAGQTLDVDITLTSDRRLNTFVLEEGLDSRLGMAIRVPVATVARDEETVSRYSFTPRVRGIYKIGPLSAEFADPFGIARRHQQLLEPTELIVHPNTEEVLDRPLTRAFEDPPLRPPHSRPWPDGFEFYGMRDYVPGDDMRRIVWRAFGRTDKLLVREFEQGINDRIAIVLDTDVAWHSAGEVSESFETAVQVAASAGVRHIKDGFTVRLEANGGATRAAPRHGFRGPRSRLPYLDTLARVERSPDPLYSSLERLSRSGRSDVHIVVITSHLDPDSTNLLNLLVTRGASATVCVLLWEETDLMTVPRAQEVGAQIVQVKPGASITGVFRASLQSNLRSVRK